MTAEERGRKEGEGRAEKEIQTVSKKITSRRVCNRETECRVSFFFLHFAQYHSTEIALALTPFEPFEIRIKLREKSPPIHGVCVCRRNVGFGATFGVGYENETQERRS